MNKLLMTAAGIVGVTLAANASAWVESSGGYPVMVAQQVYAGPPQNVYTSQPQPQNVYAAPQQTYMAPPPVYAAPPQAYVAQQPAYVQQPVYVQQQPVYVQPPVYVAPAPVFVSQPDYATGVIAAGAIIGGAALIAATSGRGYYGGYYGGYGRGYGYGYNNAYRGGYNHGGYYNGHTGYYRR